MSPLQGRDVVRVHEYQGRTGRRIHTGESTVRPHGHHEVPAARLPVKAVAAGLRSATHRLFC